MDPGLRAYGVTDLSFIPAGPAFRFYPRNFSKSISRFRDL